MFWVVRCGLNWTATLSTEGIWVTVDGAWQACDKDQSFDLEGNGEWNLSAKRRLQLPRRAGSYQPQEQAIPWAISAAWTVATGMQSTEYMHLMASLDKNEWGVSFEGVEKSGATLSGGTTLSGQFTKKNTEAGTVEALGAHVDDTSARDTFNTALNACVADLPADENWTLGSD
uniref:Uncharacterized protein n=1 Tax=Pyricularia oryzae (strain P131) TaxID=1143193 RepID=L7JMR5_PYRO1